MTLVMYNQSEAKPLGKKSFKVVNLKNKKKYSIEFLIVSGPCKSILGLRPSEHLQLLTISKQNILAMNFNAVQSGVSTKENYLSQYKDVFSGERKMDGQGKVPGWSSAFSSVNLCCQRSTIELNSFLGSYYRSLETYFAKITQIFALRSISSKF